MTSVVIPTATSDLHWYDDTIPLWEWRNIGDESSDLSPLPPGRKRYISPSGMTLLKIDCGLVNSFCDYHLFSDSEQS
jgi:hypothetical protein